MLGEVGSLFARGLIFHVCGLGVAYPMNNFGFAVWEEGM